MRKQKFTTGKSQQGRTRERWRVDWNCVKLRQDLREMEVVWKVEVSQDTREIEVGWREEVFQVGLITVSALINSPFRLHNTTRQLLNMLEIFQIAK